MPSDDVENHMAASFPLLVSDLQRGDVLQFEEGQRKQAEQRAMLRAQVPNQGMTAGELLKKIDGDPADGQRKMEEDLARINKEAQATVAQKDKKDEPLPEGHFPPPPTSG